MKKIQLIFTGGYLGAGKTTLLQKAIQSPSLQERTIGLITNDQSDSLVDTRFLAKSNSLVQEVGGSCFCCNYGGLVEAIEKLVEKNNALDLIFAEPVGSCTDISATILQPLKELKSIEVALAPFTVLAEPQKLIPILDGNNAGMHPSAAYIYRKQLEESDVILISKSDQLSVMQAEVLTEKLKLVFPDREILPVSARNNEGMEEWLKFILTNRISGARILEVDYDVYAEGEAVLGWLNASVFLQGKKEDWNLFLKEYFEKLNFFLKEQTQVHHIKIMMEDAAGQHVIGNQTGPRHTLEFRKGIEKCDYAQMTINARVEIEPGKLQQIIFDALSLTAKDEVFFDVRAVQSVSPGYPTPTNRYSYVV